MQDISKQHFKDLLDFRFKKHREERHTFIVEGWRLIKQILAYGVIPQELYLSDVSSPELLTWANSLSIPIYRVSAPQLERLVDTKSPQPVAALLKPKQPVLADWKRIVYLDHISDPGNLGTIVRTTVSAGYDGVVLSPDCCEVLNPKVIRSSLGAVFALPVVVRDYAWLQEQQACVIASSLTDAGNLFKATVPNPPFVVVIGSEAHGIHPDLLQKANVRYYIPQLGGMESLNAATAAGIFLYYLRKDDFKNI